MKNLKIILVSLVLFVAFEDSNSADPPEKSTTVVNWPYGAYAPCGNNGAGEWVWGTLAIRITRIVKDKGMHETYIPLGGDLAGVDSGENFRAVGAATNTYNSSGDGGNGTEVWINHYIGDMGTKLKVYHKIHWTVNANGVPTINFDHSVEDCK